MHTVYNLRDVTMGDESGERVALTYEGLLDDADLRATLAGADLGDPESLDEATCRSVALALAAAIQAMPS